MFKIENLLLNKTIKPMYDIIESIEMRVASDFELSYLDIKGWYVVGVKYVVVVFINQPISVHFTHIISTEIGNLVFNSLGYETKNYFYDIGVLFIYGNKIVGEWLI